MAARPPSGTPTRKTSSIAAAKALSTRLLAGSASAWIAWTLLASSALGGDAPAGRLPNRSARCTARRLERTAPKSAAPIELPNWRTNVVELGVARLDQDEERAKQRG